MGFGSSVCGFDAGGLGVDFGILLFLRSECDG